VGNRQRYEVQIQRNLKRRVSSQYYRVLVKDVDIKC
jgi:hypothetical protein